MALIKISNMYLAVVAKHGYPLHILLLLLATITGNAKAV